MSGAEPPPWTLYKRLALIGCGMIGSSVVRAARARGVVAEVAIFDPDPRVMDRVRTLKLANDLPGSAREAVAGADLVIFACPPLSIVPAALELEGAYAPGATISDVGSVKAAVADGLIPLDREDIFVIPGHPIAGAETSGPDAGRPGLFEGRWTILTPRQRTDRPYQEALGKLTAFWTALGAQVDTMDERHHDLVLAVTSHLPHLIAYNIVGTAADMETVTRSEVIKYSAGGFRDFTRIAASDPVMWRDVFLANKEAVLEIVGRFIEDLQALSRAIRWGEGDKLHELFTRTREIRRGVIDAAQDTAEPDFGRRGG